MLAVLALVGCSEQRNRPEPPAECPTWQGDIAERLQSMCGECHSGSTPAGGYGLDSYAAALAVGGDGEPAVIAGDERSRLLTALSPDTADETHRPFSDQLAVLRQWVVACEASHRESRIHPPGILDPASADFHGADLRANGWDFERCAECHGEAFDGGSAQSPCTTCHTEGPTDCGTCHGPELLDQGAHGTPAGHVRDPVDFDDCGVCHVSPADYRTVGHILTADGEVDLPPAEVVFSGVAALGDRASYEPETRTCVGVYCHGGTLDDGAATNASPMWTSEPGQAECGSCHGLPPEGHASSACDHCHGEVMDRERRHIRPDLHMDGVVQVDGGDEDCGACHGAVDAPAPGPDLDGRVRTTELTVGAHARHLLAPSRISAPVPCEACHVVPTELDSPGHIDSDRPAEVFTVAEGLAFAGGAMPTWDRERARCSDVYCHGGGTTRLGSDTSPTLNRSPVWTRVQEGEAACGACHGVPPDDGLHASDLTVFECHDCHTSVNEFGAILMTMGPGGPSSDHIDGEVDVR